jgi:hypothetical protein
MCVYGFAYVFGRSARVAVSSAHSRRNGPIVRAMADGSGETPPVKAKEKSSVPETAPAVVGTAMNQLLGMKGAAIETVWHFNALLWSMTFIFCSCRLVELCLQKPSSAYSIGFHEKLC